MRSLAPWHRLGQYQELQEALCGPFRGLLPVRAVHPGRDAPGQRRGCVPAAVARGRGIPALPPRARDLPECLDVTWVRLWWSEQPGAGPVVPAVPVVSVVVPGGPPEAPRCHIAVPRATTMSHCGAAAARRAPGVTGPAGRAGRAWRAVPLRGLVPPPGGRARPCRARHGPPGAPGRCSHLARGTAGAGARGPGPRRRERDRGKDTAAQARPGTAGPPARARARAAPQRSRTHVTSRHSGRGT